MASQTVAHLRELFMGCLSDVSHRVMALPTANVPLAVDSMVEVKVGIWKNDPRDSIPVFRLISKVTCLALGEGVVATHCHL